MLDRELSAEVAQQIDPCPRACFESALDALDHLPDTATYVEGWIIKPGDRVLGEHAWCEVNNRVVDPVYYERDRAAYVAGARYTKRKAKALYGALRRLPLVRYTVDGVDHNRYLIAMAQAQRTARNLLRGASNGSKPDHD